MRPLDIQIEETMKNKLDSSMPPTEFSTVWNKHRQDSRKTGLRRIKAAPKVVLVGLLVLMAFGFAFKPTFDKTDYAFVNDPQVIGKWETVDYVKDVGDFRPGIKAEDSKLFIMDLVFLKDGKMLAGGTNHRLGFCDFNWTKGLMICKPVHTAGKYEIKNIDGTEYMFCEWKNGDYVFFHRKPSYLVLTKADSRDYSDYKFTRTEDKIDYAFVNDPELLGSWECVDYVKKMDDFRPNNRLMETPLFLKRFDISENGRIDAATSERKLPDGFLTWTKGLVICKTDKTASKYEIKEIGGDTYLFFEFKSGNYIFGGQKPEYFVLKKAD